jgi:hypothetical protein
MIRSLSVIVPAPGVIAITAPYGPSAGLLMGTSESSIVLGTGPQSFVMEQFGLSFQTGVRVRMSTEVDPTNTWMEGVVTSYAEPNLNVTVDLIHGAGGSYNEWNIGVTGQVGQQGIPGAVGPVGPVGQVPEAPLDGVNYGRNKAQWNSLDVLYIREAPTDLHNYARKSANWSNIDALFASLASPAFTGTPTAPTAPVADNSTKLATTAYADRLLTPTGGGAPINSPAFTGAPTAPTVTPGSDTSTKLATTAFVQAAIAAIGGGIADAPADSHNYARRNNLWNNIDAFFAGYAPINSPVFTGTPQAPTPAPGDNSINLATTAFVAASQTGFATTAAVQAALIAAMPEAFFGGAANPNAANPTTAVDVAAFGVAAAAGGPAFIQSTSVLTKTTATWAAGSNHGGLAPGLTLAANTWYHIYAATINGLPDVFFDTTLPPTHLPTGLTTWRRLMAFKTDASKNIWPWQMVDRDVIWTSSHGTDYSGGAPQNLFALPSVPLGIRVIAHLSYIATNSASACTGDLFDGDANTSNAGWSIWLNAGTWNGGDYHARTNKLAQVNGSFSTEPNSNSNLTVRGWRDPVSPAAYA